MFVTSTFTISNCRLSKDIEVKQNKNEKMFKFKSQNDETKNFPKCSQFTRSKNIFNSKVFYENSLFMQPTK